MHYDLNKIHYKNPSSGQEAFSCNWKEVNFIFFLKS